MTQHGRPSPCLIELILSNTVRAEDVVIDNRPTPACQDVGKVKEGIAAFFGVGHFPTSV